MEPSVVARSDLAEQGAARIEWVQRHMPILQSIQARFTDEQPFAGLHALVCIHLEAKTANLALTLAAGGAEVAVTGSNPDSTKDDIVAALDARGLAVYARHGASPDEMRAYMRLALDINPNFVIDDGGDIVEIMQSDRRDLLAGLFGVCEETTTGVVRARESAALGELAMPVFAINDARCKYLFDNVHGTGQSVWDAIMRSGNTTVSGKRVVVVGYGWCGRGIAMRADGLGARVIVCERDPVKAADAAMNGFDVMPLAQACGLADIIVTATGVEHTLAAEHFALMRDGVMLANAGHFWTEIDAASLAEQSVERNQMRECIEAFHMSDGRCVYLLGDANIVNIACADGHPAEIMDTSFALQALTAEHLCKYHATLAREVHAVPSEIDDAVARLKLAAMDLQID